LTKDSIVVGKANYINNDIEFLPEYVSKDKRLNYDSNDYDSDDDEDILEITGEYTYIYNMSNKKKIERLG
jgi:hypothetical protein